jgi:hypothetical protein
VACSTRSEKTSLTESQARALADWWGGRYHQIFSPEGPNHACHGVIIETSGAQDSTAPASCQRTIFSLEEARILEQLRGHDNQGATDWVG